MAACWSSQFGTRWLLLHLRPCPACSQTTAGSVALLALALPGITFYALAMTNVGTGLRDRAQFTCFVFVYDRSRPCLLAGAKGRASQGPSAHAHLGRRGEAPAARRDCH